MFHFRLWCYIKNILSAEIIFQHFLVMKWVLKLNGTVFLETGNNSTDSENDLNRIVFSQSRMLQNLLQNSCEILHSREKLLLDRSSLMNSIWFPRRKRLTHNEQTTEYFMNRSSQKWMTCVLIFLNVKKSNHFFIKYFKSWSHSKLLNKTGRENICNSEDFHPSWSMTKWQIERYNKISQIFLIDFFDIFFFILKWGIPEPFLRINWHLS